MSRTPQILLQLRVQYESYFKPQLLKMLEGPHHDMALTETGFQLVRQDVTLEV